MGVSINSETTFQPISLIGEMCGVCWGADTADFSKNYMRGLECINNNHGRTIEFPDVYMTLSGYSARVMREFYTHIGGAPTRLQESTRYVDCNNFQYIYPPAIKQKVRERYEDIMHDIKVAYGELISLGMAKEDAANILPLGMETKVVVKINARTLMDMSRQRMCNRAYWEFRQLFNDIIKALKEYSSEWDTFVTDNFKPKCEILYYCPESKGCGRFCSKTEFEEKLIKIVELEYEE